MALTTRENLEAELVSRLQVASNSTLYPSARITSIIKQSYIWATQLVIWHDLVRSRCTSTVAGNEYYDYPENFRSESIIRLTIDGEPYKRYNFEDYLAFKKRNPDSNRKIFASFGRQFFISPTPQSTGTDNLLVWGAIQADPLINSSDVSIFSYNKEEANEAVIKKGMSIALVRSDPAVAKQEEQDAIALLLKLSSDEQKNTQRNQRLAHPMMSVPDFFGSTSSNYLYGRFAYDPEEIY